MSHISRLANRIRGKLHSKESSSADRLTIQFLHLIKRCGYTPKLVLDIGANHGQWVDRCLQVFPEASYILFEPQKDVFEGLQQHYSLYANIELVNAGAGNTTETKEIWLNPERDDSASFIKEICQSASGIEVTERQVAQVYAVDDWLATKQLSPDVIKIDAEGLDLEVIHGGKDAIGKSSIVFAEASIVNKTSGVCLGELISTMSSHGFALVDFTDLNRTKKTSALWLVEAAFARRDSQIFEKVRSYLD